MAKTVRVPVLMDEELREKAKRDSIEMFGSQNVSALIKFLLKNHKPVKS